MTNQWLGKLDETWSAWLRTLDRVDPARREERDVCGHWSVKDLVGHVTVWDAEVLTDIQRWRHGLEMVTNDWQRINDDDHALKLHRPYDLLRIEMHLIHQTVRDAIAQLPDELSPEFVERLDVDLWDHYDCHREDIERWIGQDPT